MQGSTLQHKLATAEHKCGREYPTVGGTWFMLIVTLARIPTDTDASEGAVRHNRPPIAGKSSL
jgi:hypothetical protein